MPGFQPAFIYPFAVNGLLAFSQIFMVVYGYKFSDRFKVQYAFFTGTLLILSLPLLAHFLGSASQSFWSCFVVLLAFGIVNGVVQAQVFGLAGILPGKYIGAVMFGNGLSGIGANLLRLIFVIALPSDTLYLQAQIHFILSGLTLFMSGYAYNILIKNEYFIHFKSISEKNVDKL